jgi:hypothetical protein
MSEKLSINGIACIELQAKDPDLRSELILMASHCLQEEIKQTLLGE